MDSTIPQDDTPRKQCGACKKYLAATPDNFSRDKSKKDGLRTKCKRCAKLYKKQYYQANKERILKQTGQY